MLVIISLVLTFIVYNTAFLSVLQALIQLGHSSLAYFRFTFLQQLSERPIRPPSGEINILPDTTAGFVFNLGSFFRTLFSGVNFRAFANSLESLILGLMMLLPFIILAVFMLRRYIIKSFTKKHNNRYNQDTKPLKAFKWCLNHLCHPPIHFILSVTIYILSTHFKKILLLIWLFNFNAFAIILHIISISLYFFISFDFVALYYFLYNIAVLLMPTVTTIPVILWLILVLYLIDRRRKIKAYDLLNHMEAMNKGFINEREICVLLCGAMGKGKTTLITDMMLSTESYYRYKARQMMYDIDLKFPYFPWINFENDIKVVIDKGYIYNWASACAWVDKQQQIFEFALYKCAKRNIKHPYSRNLIFGYDFIKYGLDYDDKKTVTTIFEALKDYVQLYFLYIVNTSLIFANYSVRTDFGFLDSGNMPKWDLDFFKKDSRLIRTHSKHAHILNFDILRLGKKLVKNNAQSACFEFGIIGITEVGKERGNQFKEHEIKDRLKKEGNHLKAKELTDNRNERLKVLEQLDNAKADGNKKEVEKLENRATILNDKFNSALKLIRHKCTVGGFPFARVFMDEQRPESLGVDCRDLCEVVKIKYKSEPELTLKKTFIGELIYSFIVPKFLRVYEDYRHNRGDNTLLMFLLKALGGGVYRYNNRIHNRFGYFISSLEVEDAASEKVIKVHPYYVSFKKIYSNRFTTDAFKDVFAKSLIKCGVGIKDIPCYATHKMVESEMLQQNSYLIIDEIQAYSSLNKGD